jgi:hypothetical protein
VCALAVSALPAAVARAQSYGTGDQVLTIGPAEFQPGDWLTAGRFTRGSTDRYIYGCCDYLAPLNLPDGAVVTLMCLYAYDADPEAAVQATLQEVSLPAGGQSPGYGPVASVATTFDIGWGTVCTSPLSYVVHSSDAIGVHRAHEIEVESHDSLGLGGVRITWHRQVSPLPAASSFDDVALGSQYSQFIEALKAAGITGGCQADPPLYCPDRPITRAEMAVYLSLALGLHWAE